IHCGDWSGSSLEAPAMQIKNPLVGIWGNGFLLLLDNFAPTFFPQASWWNDSFFSLVPRAIGDALRENFDTGFEALHEMPSEDWAGLGFGLSVLLVASVRAARRAMATRDGGASATTLSPVCRQSAAIPSVLRRCALIAGWVA